MWIKLYGGQLKPNIKYRVIPQEEYDALKSSHDKLVEALKKYGNHLRDCPYFHPILLTEEIKCNCGLEQAWKEAEKL